MESPLVGSPAVLDIPAVVGHDGNWTWRQIHAASLALATRLNGVGTVCNLCRSRAAFLITWLAALRCECLQLLPPSGGHAELLATLKSADRLLAVVDDQTSWLPDGAAGSRLFLHLPELRAAGAPNQDLCWSPAWDVAAVQLFTSGTTGAPEPHRKTLGQLAHGAQILGLRLEQEVVGGLATLRRILCSVPAQHMFGLEASVMLSLVHGIAIIDGSPLLPADVGSAFESHGSGTLWVATPIHLRAFVASGHAVPNCGGVLVSTMALAPGLAADTEALVDAPVLEIYGSTETGAVAMRRTALDASWHPLHGVRVEPSKQGTDFWGAHFPSPQTLLDQVERDAHGGFRLLGRQSDLIKIGGRRASLAGLNLLLQDLPGLIDGAFYLPATGAATTRLVLIHAGPPLDRASVESWLRDRMDPVFLPRAIIQVDRLPRDPSGKLPRAALDAIFDAWAAEKALR